MPSIIVHLSPPVDSQVQPCQCQCKMSVKGCNVQFLWPCMKYILEMFGGFDVRYLAYQRGGLLRQKEKGKSFQAVYTDSILGSYSISSSQSWGPCWLTFGWLSSPPTRHCYSSVFPSDVLFSPQSLSCSQLWEESKQANSSKEAQTGECCQKNRTICTKPLFPALWVGDRWSQWE